MVKDPPVRDDGLCVVCLGPRKPAKPSSVNAEHRAAAALDPFCSSPCCRRWYADEGRRIDRW